MLHKSVGNIRIFLTSRVSTKICLLCQLADQGKSLLNKCKHQAKDEDCFSIFYNLFRYTYYMTHLPGPGPGAGLLTIDDPRLLLLVAGDNGNSILCVTGYGIITWRGRGRRLRMTEASGAGDWRTPGSDRTLRRKKCFTFIEIFILLRETHVEIECD